MQLVYSRKKYDKANTLPNVSAYKSAAVWWRRIGGQRKNYTAVISARQPVGKYLGRVF